MQPQIVLTFANPSESESGFLRSLRRERGEIESALWAAKNARMCGVDVRSDVTRAGLIDHLQTAKTVEYAVIFHYGGHASGSALALGRGDANARGVAAMLGALPRLHFVFLNGCSTGAQVEALLDNGVPTVLATRADVVDAAATDFAIHLYRRLGEGSTLRGAFDEAVAAVQTLHTRLTMARVPPSGSSRRRKKVVRDPGVPWQLHSRQAPNAPDPLEWSLPLAADDPLFVLPQPAAVPVDAPFRGAASYRVEDAAVFFGRGHEIRAAYDALMAQTPVVLHGPRGAGRTSIIHAGLRARLLKKRAIAVTPSTLPAAGQCDVLLIDDAEGLSDAQIAQASRLAPAVLFAVESAHRARFEVALASHATVLVPLAHVDAAAIRRIIEGPARRSAFAYTPQLPARLVAELAGPGATTPIVSAVLTALWAGRSGELITGAQYAAFKSEGGLNSLVDAALTALAGQRAEWVESGFALDVLAHHTTLLGTAKSHDSAALTSRYAHRGDVDVFVDAACARWLIVRTQTGTALAHDLLAPLVNGRFATSRAPAQQARRIVEERLPSWRDGTDGVTLDAADLAVVVAGRPSMPALDADGVRLIEASDAAVRARARRTRIARLTLLTAAVVIVALAFVWQKQRSMAKVQAAHAAATLAKSQAQGVIDARDLSARLVQTYRSLDGVDPHRASRGLRQLVDLAAQFGESVPGNPALVLRAWSMVVTSVVDGPLRLQRPTVLSAGGQAHLIDRAGRFHRLARPPKAWFVTPGGRWVVVLDDALTLYDAQSGAPSPHGAFAVHGTIEAMGLFEAPNTLMALVDAQASEAYWALLAIDLNDGRGETVKLEDTEWSGRCKAIPVERSPTTSGLVQPVIGADGRLNAASTTAGRSDRVSFKSCLQHRITTRSPRTVAVADFEPQWRRWSAELIVDAGRRSSLVGGPSEMPEALADERHKMTDGDACMRGCGFVEPEDESVGFAVGAQTLLIERGVCDLFGGSDWLTRWCTTDGRSGYLWEPIDMRSVRPDMRPAPRRRGGFLLFQGNVLRFSDMTPLTLQYQGVAWDFALSPDETRLALLTDRGLLHLVRESTDNGARYVERARELPGDDPFRAAVWISEEVVVVQRASGTMAVRVADDAILWLRSASSTHGGLAVGAGMVAIRRGDAIRLVVAADGTALSPIERPGIAGAGAITMDIEPDGALVLQDDQRRLRRAALPVTPRPVPKMPMDLWLRAHPDKRVPAAAGSPCVAGRAVRDGECW